jgi:hypothetical protein
VESSSWTVRHPAADHEVAVIGLGTNHSPTDPTYYPDDVVYFDTLLSH